MTWRTHRKAWKRQLLEDCRLGWCPWSWSTWSTCTPTAWPGGRAGLASLPPSRGWRAGWPSCHLPPPPVQVQTVPYRAWCRLELQRRAEDLGAGGELEEVLEQAGLWEPLWRGGKVA